jgi:hypothetical protein
MVWKCLHERKSNYTGCLSEEDAKWLQVWHTSINVCSEHSARAEVQMVFDREW